MLLKEKALILLTLSGPIICILGIVAWEIYPNRRALVPVLSVTTTLSILLTLAGLAACIVVLVNPKNKGRPKLLWILLGLLDLLLVYPILSYICDGRSIGSN